MNEHSPKALEEARALTNKNQADAADPYLSVWVSANAGTGKTHVLVLRVLRLLLAGTPAGAYIVPDLYQGRRRRNVQSPVRATGQNGPP